MKLALLGDIALIGELSYENNAKVEDRFKQLADYLSSFDYVVANLESPFSIRRKRYGAKSAYLYSDVRNIEILKQLHIKAVTLSNNHIFDYGNEGFDLTKKLLQEHEIAYFGVDGKNYLVEVAGNKLAFSGYCCFSTNPLNNVREGCDGVNAYNVEDVRNALKRYSQYGYLNILAVHAGLEHVNYPSLDHIRLARSYSDICPYVYYGHHPHVIQGVEEYNGSLIAHSLGNFCFDDIYENNNSKAPFVELTEQNRTGAILELEIDNSKVVSWEERIVYNDKTKGLMILDTPNGGGIMPLTKPLFPVKRMSRSIFHYEREGYQRGMRIGSPSGRCLSI